MFATKGLLATIMLTAATALGVPTGYVATQQDNGVSAQANYNNNYWGDGCVSVSELELDNDYLNCRMRATGIEYSGAWWDSDSSRTLYANCAAQYDRAADSYDPDKLKDFVFRDTTYYNYSVYAPDKGCEFPASGVENFYHWGEYGKHFNQWITETSTGGWWGDQYSYSYNYDEVRCLNTPDTGSVRFTNAGTDLSGNTYDVVFDIWANNYVQGYQQWTGCTMNAETWGQDFGWGSGSYYIASWDSHGAPEGWVGNSRYYGTWNGSYNDPYDYNVFQRPNANVNIVPLRAYADSNAPIIGWWLNTYGAEANATVKYVKHGTNDLANIKTFATLSDIDAYDGAAWNGATYAWDKGGNPWGVRREQCMYGTECVGTNASKFYVYGWDDLPASEQANHMSTKMEYQDWMDGCYGWCYSAPYCLGAGPEDSYLCGINACDTRSTAFIKPVGASYDIYYGAREMCGIGFNFWLPESKVNYYVDGNYLDQDTCYAFTPYYPRQDFTARAQKANCTVDGNPGLQAWYWTDGKPPRDYFVPGTRLKGETNIYSRNRYTLFYDYTSDSEHNAYPQYYIAPRDGAALGSIDLPPSEVHYIGDTMTLNNKNPLYFRNDRESAWGTLRPYAWYANKQGTGSTYGYIQPTSDCTYYIRWQVATADGVVDTRQ